MFTRVSLLEFSQACIFCRVLSAISLTDGLYTLTPLGQKLVASAQQSSCDELLQGINVMKSMDFPFRMKTQRGVTDVEVSGQLMNFEFIFRTACDMLPTLDYMRRMS
jgi:hypothetical protein